MSRYFGCHAKEKVHFNRNFIFIVLAYWNNSPLVENDVPLWHIILTPSQSPFCCMQMLILRSLVWPDLGPKPTIINTWSKHGNHYNIVFLLWRIVRIHCIKPRKIYEVKNIYNNHRFNANYTVEELKFLECSTHSFLYVTILWSLYNHSNQPFHIGRGDHVLHLLQKFEDTKSLIRSHISKKDRQYNGQKDQQWSIKHYTEN
jgi:hypothetical protein